MAMSWRQAELSLAVNDARTVAARRNIGARSRRQLAASLPAGSLNLAGGFHRRFDGDDSVRSQDAHEYREAQQLACEHGDAKNVLHVSTLQSTLIVPVIRKAPGTGFAGIAEALSFVAAEARAGATSASAFGSPRAGSGGGTRPGSA
ncbi:hypothetical protein [Bradyrhizobium sp. USDA 4519]